MATGVGTVRREPVKWERVPCSMAPSARAIGIVGGLLVAAITPTCKEPNAPVEILASHIAAGWARTCMLSTASAAYCWGENGAGGLGNDSFSNSPAPVALVGTSTSACLQRVAVTPAALRTLAKPTAGAAMCSASLAMARPPRAQHRSPSQCRTERPRMRSWRLQRPRGSSPCDVRTSQYDYRR